MARTLRSIGKFVHLNLLFLFGAFQLIVTRPATRRQRAEWLHSFAARLIRAMGITIRVEGRFPERGGLISNHMGYLDIMTVAALHPVVFVSALELSQVPLLGWMTTMAGTVYVERGRGGSAARASTGIQSAADEGLPIAFFPEGTTTDGSSVLPFRSGLIAQMLEARQPITAACVHYRLLKDNGPGVTLQHDVAYTGDDVTLFPHIFHLISVRGIEVSLHIADAPIAFSPEAFIDRKVAAIEARAAVLQIAGLPDTVTTV